MKLKAPRSIQSWLFLGAVVMFLAMALLYAAASFLAAHGQVGTANSTNPGLAATWPAFAMPIGILEFVGLSFLILAAIVSIFRSIIPPKS